MTTRKDQATGTAAALNDLPLGLFVGANRYDTDDSHVLHLWTEDGRSFDVMWPKPRRRTVSGWDLCDTLTPDGICDLYLGHQGDHRPLPWLRAGSAGSGVSA